MKRTLWIVVVCIGLLLFISGCGGGGGGDGSSAAPVPDVNEPTQLIAFVNNPILLDAAAISGSASAPVGSEWSIVTRPPSSNANLIDDPNISTPQFTPDAPGDYEVVLTLDATEYQVNITAYALGTIKLVLPGKPVVMAIQRTSDEGFVFSGSVANATDNTSNAFAAKTDSFGNLQWSRIAGGTGDDHFNLAMEIVAGDGGYLFAGATDSNEKNAQGDDIYLLRLDADGDPIWEGVYGGLGDEGARTMLELPDGGMLLAGTTDINTTVEMFLLKIDADKIDVDGVESAGWPKTIGKGTDDLIVNDMKNTADGFVLTGYFRTGSSSTDIYLAKFNLDGGIEWEHTHGNNGGTNIGRFVFEDANDGSFVIAGRTNATSLVGGSQSQIYMLKTDATGAILNEAVLGGEGIEYLYDVAKTDDNGFILTGFTNSTSLGAVGYDAYLAKTDSAGNLEWEKAIGGAEDDIAVFVEPTSSDGLSEDGYLMAGFVDGTLELLPTGISMQGTFAITRTDVNGGI